MSEELGALRVGEFRKDTVKDKEALFQLRDKVAILIPPDLPLDINDTMQKGFPERRCK